MFEDGSLAALRVITVILSTVALGTNLYVTIEAVKQNARSHRLLAAWAYPAAAALTSAAIIIGRTIAFFDGERGIQTTDLFGPIIAMGALFAGWQATSSLAYMSGAEDARELLATIAEQKDNAREEEANG